MLRTSVEGGSPASAHRVVTGTHRQTQTRSVAAPALFLYKKVRCPLLLCDVLWFAHSELIASHGSCASGGPGLQGPSNGAKHAVLSPSPGRPAPLGSCFKPSTRPPPGLEKRRAYGKRAFTNQCSPSAQPRCSCHCLRCCRKDPREGSQRVPRELL